MFASAWSLGTSQSVIKSVAHQNTKGTSYVMTITTIAAVAGMVVTAVERAKTSLSIVKHVDVQTPRKIQQTDIVHASTHVDQKIEKEMGCAMMRTTTAVVNLMVGIAAGHRVTQNSSSIVTSASAKHQKVCMCVVAYSYVCVNT